MDMAMSFTVISGKRVYTFPKMGEASLLYCNSYSLAGTGSEVTPFAVIAD